MARSNGSPRRATLIASALVVGVIVVAGAILTGRALISGDDDGTNATVPPTSADSSSKCDLPDGELEKLTVPPSGVEWDLINTFAFPSSDAGPGDESDGIRSCYARSTEGALLAASNWLFAYLVPDVDLTSATELLTTGPNSDALTDYVAALTPAEREQVSEVSGIGQIAGFRVDSISADQAVVQVVLRRSQGGDFWVFPVDLKWEDGDWRVVVEPVGETTVSPVNSLAGYTEWGGA